MSPPSAVGWGCRGLHGAKADASLRRGLAAKSARGDEYLGWAQVGLGTRKGSWLGGTLGRKPAPGVSVAQWFPLGMGLCVSLCSEVSAPFSHFAGFSQPSDLLFPLSPGTTRCPPGGALAAWGGSSVGDHPGCQALGPAWMSGVSRTEGRGAFGQCRAGWGHHLEAGKKLGIPLGLSPIYHLSLVLVHEQKGLYPQFYSPARS